jgi:hypothetical protein
LRQVNSRPSSLAYRQAVKEETECRIASSKRLRVYTLADTLAGQIWEIVIKRDKFAKDAVGKQITKVADSIGANIAGTGRGSFADERAMTTGTND